ncbi:MAG: type II secretion system F family protein [Micromonosporaceae bacterium]|nr:type II secretion system F family protein [Micromonosporaceae bacterium]
MSRLFVLAVLGGGVVGAGLGVLCVALLPAVPALGPALDRLYPTTRQPERQTFVRWLSRNIQVPRQDLAILGRTSEGYVVALIVNGLAALAVPATVGVVSAMLGLGVPPTIPVGGAVLFAAVGVWLAHRSVLEKARAARAEFVRALCTYLDLAATQVRSGHGPMESLERAVGICHGWVFDHLRAALARARLRLTPPWDELKRLSLELNVVELGDLADIMRSAGTDGAQVYQTLRARADSLRDQIRTEELEAAELRTNKLDMPAAALILVLLGLMGYPFMAALLAF